MVKTVIKVVAVQVTDLSDLQQAEKAEYQVSTEQYELFKIKTIPPPNLHPQHLNYD